MIRTATLLATFLLAAAPALAQDISPVISPNQAAEGAFHRSRMGAQAEAIRKRNAAQPRPGSPEFRRQVCANRPMFRRQHGANDPRVRKLDSLCAAAGY